MSNELLPIYDLLIIGYAARLDSRKVPYYPPLVFGRKGKLHAEVILPPYRMIKNGQSIEGTPKPIQAFFDLIANQEATALPAPISAKPNHLLLLLTSSEWKYFPQNQFHEQERNHWQCLFRTALTRYIYQDPRRTINILIQASRICRDQPEEMISLSLLLVLLRERPQEISLFRQRQQELIRDHPDYLQLEDRIDWLLALLGSPT